MKRILKTNYVCIIFILTMIIISNAYATDNGIVNYGGNKDDYFNDTIIDDKNLIAVGKSNSTDIKDITNIGGHDAILVKYDQNGSIVWQKNYGTANSDSFDSVVVTSDGYIVVGYKNSSSTNNKDATGVFVKFDKQGNIVWDKYYKSADGTKFYEIEKISDEEYIIVGEKYEQNEQIPIILKVDKNGDIIFEELSLNDYRDCSFLKIILTEEKEYVLLLYDQTNSIILKLNKDGKKIWDNTYDMDQKQNPVFKDGILTEKGTYLIVGGNAITSTPGGSSNENLAFILEYDKFGNLLNEVIFDKNKQSRFNSVIEMKNEYVVIGQVSDFEKVDISAMTENNFDVKIFKFDKNNKKLIEEKDLGIKSSYAFYNSSFSVSKLTEEDYYAVVNVVEKSSLNTRIIKQKKIFEEENVVDKVEVPDTLSNTSVIMIILGVLLSCGGVVSCFIMLKRKSKKGKMNMKKIKKISVIVLILFLTSVYNVYASEIATIRYGGNKSDYFQDVIVDGNNIIAIGTTASTDIEGLTNIGEYDGIIVKYDKNDAIVWQKNYGTKISDSLNSVIATTDGYIVVGYKNSSNYLDFIDATAVILKLDKNGNILWEKEYKKYNGTGFSDVEQTKEGEYIVTATAYNDDIKVPILIKYDSLGNIKLEKVLTDYEDYSIKKAILSKTNGYTLLLHYYDHSVLLNLTEDGIKKWDNKYTMDKEFPMFEDGILTTSDTYLIVGGNESNATMGARTSEDLAFILEYDKNGELLSENIFKNYKQSRFNRIIEIENRYIIIGQVANLEWLDVSNAVTESFDVKVFKFNYNKELIDEVSTGIKSSYTLYNDSFSVAKLTDNDYFIVVNFFEKGSYKWYDAAILKTKNVFQEEIEDPNGDIIIDNNEQIEVPDTLDNPSVIALAVGILLIFGGVILYFGILKSKLKKS